MSISIPKGSKHLVLAGVADCDHRTAARALEKGLEAVRGRPLRERLSNAARELGLVLPSTPPPSAA